MVFKPKIKSMLSKILAISLSVSMIPFGNIMAEDGYSTDNWWENKDGDQEISKTEAEYNTGHLGATVDKEGITVSNVSPFYEENIFKHIANYEATETTRGYTYTTTSTSTTSCDCDGSGGGGGSASAANSSGGTETRTITCGENGWICRGGKCDGNDYEVSVRGREFDAEVTTTVDENGNETYTTNWPEGQAHIVKKIGPCT